MIKVDTSKLKTKVQGFKRNIDQNAKSMLNEAHWRTAQKLSYQTPPPKEVNSELKRIPPEYYKRPVYTVRQFIRKGEKPEDADYKFFRSLFRRFQKDILAKIKGGLKYIAIHGVKGRGRTFLLYGYSKGDAKKIQRIAYRGLMRATWGMNWQIESNKFSAYIKKSPDLNKLKNKQLVAYSKTMDGWQMVNNAGLNQPPNNLFGKWKKTAEWYLKFYLTDYLKKKVKKELNEK